MSPLYGRLFYHVIRTAIAQIKVLWKASKFDSNTANKDDLNPPPSKVQSYILAIQHNFVLSDVEYQTFCVSAFQKSIIVHTECLFYHEIFARYLF